MKRNPWGTTEGVWNGAWSTESEEWTSLDANIKQLNDMQLGDEGEFWMTYEDFLSSWTSVDIVHLDVNCFESEEEVCLYIDYCEYFDKIFINFIQSTNLRWSQTKYLGQWKQYATKNTGKYFLLKS